jgi:hypothetical protein
MIHLQIITDIEASGHDWSDLEPERFGKLVGIGRLTKGTQQGKSTVTVRMQMPDGSFVYGETTLQMLTTAVQALNAVEERGT